LKNKREMLVPDIAGVQPFFDVRILREPDQGTDQPRYIKSTLYEGCLQATLYNVRTCFGFVAKSPDLIGALRQ